MPQHLTPFPDNSPFRGLDHPDEVTVSRQVLAEPSVELADHTWARLADGTPLVTGTATRPRLDRAVPYHRQPRLVDAAAVGTLCRHAAPGAGAVGACAAAPAAAQTGTFPPYPDAGRLRPSGETVPEATPIRGARKSSRTDVGPAASAGPLRRAGRADRAERLRHALDARCRSISAVSLFAYSAPRRAS